MAPLTVSTEEELSKRLKSSRERTVSPPTASRAGQPTSLTVAGVIYQQNAFTAVSDGQINLEPDKTAMNAASDALNGWDPTYGCLYYYNPAVATSSWIFGRKTVTTIGKHVFAI